MVNSKSLGLVGGDGALAAALILVGSMFSMSLQDMFMKLLSDQMSLWQFVVLRAVVALPLIWLVALHQGRHHSIRPKSVTALVIRSGLMMVALVCFFTSLSTLTMAQAAAGLYTAPLFIATLAPFVLGERVGPRRIVAIVLGFAGSMLILRPDFDASGLVALLPIAAGCFYALSLMATRKLCVQENPMTLTLFHQAGYLLLGLVGLTALALVSPSPAWQTALPFFFSAWLPLSLTVVLIVAAIGVLNVVGHTGLSYAYQTAEASFLAPFDYSYLVFACIWSIVIWNDVLVPLDYLGVAMIAGAGIFISWRGKRARPASA
jgi:drug/metabolite transporter (DMT)-like permease